MKTIFLFIIGTIIFSFLCLVLDRFPKESIVRPRSHCDSCKHPLKARDLIPILSQIINKYQCRYCNSNIPLTYLYLELCGGILFMLFSLGILTIAQLILIIMGTILSLYDIRYKEYPFVIWLICHLGVIYFTGFNLLMWFFLFIAFLSYIIDIKIGTGDFLFLASCAGLFDLAQVLWIVQIASISGILIFFIRKKQGTLAFIPCLFLALFPLLLV